MMTDLKLIGERFRQIRNQMGRSQKELAVEIGVSQTAISRLENGEEIHASTLLTILLYFHKSISLDYLLLTDFNIDSYQQSRHADGETRKLVIQQLDILRDAIISSCDVCILQLDYMKRKIKF